MSTVIVAIRGELDEPRVFGNLTKCCEELELVYVTIQSKGFPAIVEKDGVIWKLHKIKVKKSKRRKRRRTKKSKKQ